VSWARLDTSAPGSIRTGDDRNTLSVDATSIETYGGAARPP
jgi:hypothetical protein